MSFVDKTLIGPTQIWARTHRNSTQWQTSSTANQSFNGALTEQCTSASRDDGIGQLHRLHHRLCRDSAQDYKSSLRPWCCQGSLEATPSAIILPHLVLKLLLCESSSVTACLESTDKKKNLNNSAWKLCILSYFRLINGTKQTVTDKDTVSKD